MAIKKLISKKIPLYEEGYKQGYFEAQEEFEITYPCSVCGEPISMSPDGEDYEDALQHMKKAGWYHSDCANGE